MSFPGSAGVVWPVGGMAGRKGGMEGGNLYSLEGSTEIGDSRVV